MVEFVWEVVYVVLEGTWREFRWNTAVLALRRFQSSPVTSSCEDKKTVYFHNDSFK